MPRRFDDKGELVGDESSTGQFILSTIQASTGTRLSRQSAWDGNRRLQGAPPLSSRRRARAAAAGSASLPDPSLAGRSLPGLQRVFGNNFKGDPTEPKEWVSTGECPAD